MIGILENIMKKFAFVFLILFSSIILLSACSNSHNENSTSQVQNDISQNSVPQKSIIESSIFIPESINESSETEVSENSAVLPVGLTKSGKNKLKYTSSVLSLSVTFPNDFCIVNNDYTPSYGIYLQHKEGTATLLIESVEDTTYSQNEFANLLSEKYPDSDIYIDDYRCVICKRTYNDLSGNKITSFLKIKNKNGGYNEILLTCSSSDSSKFETVFNQITFS